MQKKIEMQARIHIKRHKRRKIWHKVVGSLACVVVFATTYMLILPAITMEQTSYCGIEAHKHSDSCYEERLICDIPEEQEVSHIHDETCIKEEKLLNCSEEHEHMPECYETVTTYICEPVDEKIIHTHGPECYEKVLICQMEEHEHSLPCFSNPNADVETKDIWERSVSGVKLTGVWSDDVIAIANTQMGYSESKANYLVTEDGKIKVILLF